MDNGSGGLIWRNCTDGLQADYTDAYAFTASLSAMIANNLGSSQTLIGQV